MAAKLSYQNVQERMAQLEEENQRLREEVMRLQTFKQFFREVVNNSQDIIFRRGYKNGALEYFNRAVIDVLGYTPEEIESLSQEQFLERIHPDDRDSFLTLINEALARRDQTARPTAQYRFRRKDGTYVWLDEKLTIVKDGSGNPDFVVGNVRDISDRKRAEEELKRSRDFLDNIINALDDPIFVKDELHRWIILNDSACKLIGKPRRELLGKSDTDIFSSHDADMFLGSDGIALGTGKTNTLEQNITLNGKIHTISTKTSLFTDSVTGNNYIAGTIRDVTPMKETEKALRLSEERFRTIFEKSPIGIELFDAAGNLLEANEACQVIFGTAGHPVPKNFNILDSPLIPDEVKTNIAEGKPIRFPTTVNFDLIRERNSFHTEKTGLSHLDVLITPLGTKKRAGSTSFLVHLNDITDRKEAEDALTESERIYRMLAENVSDMISTMNMNMELTYVSPSIVDLVGYNESEVMAMGISRILTEASYKKALNLFQKELLGQPEKSDGKIRTVTADFELTCKDGSLIWAEVKTRFLLDADGNPSGILGVARDVTERKQAEAQIRSLTTQLLAAQEIERERIARDLHDNLAQQLSLLKIQCHNLFDQIPSGDPEFEEKVAAVFGNLQAAIADVRHLAYNLRPPTLEQFGIVQAVFDYCNEFARTYGILVDFCSAGIEGLKLDGTIGINIYRIVQEALHNIRKHATAEHIKVRLVSSFPTIVLRIEDDGTGFDVDQRRKEAVREKRMGLVNIQERTTLLHGAMRIQSQPSKGTQLFIEIPYQEEKSLVYQDDSDR